MAKGWQKGNYNRQLFGQHIKEYRVTLQWSLGHLAQLSGMNKGTLQHVEKGESHLPDTKRQTVIDVLTEALQQIGKPANRREFLKLAGLTSVSAVLSTSSSTTQPQQGEIPGASSQEKLLKDIPHEEYADILNQQHNWQQALTFWLLAAQEAKYNGDWAKWSRCQLKAGVMAITTCQFEFAERKFKEVLNNPQHEVSMLAKAEAYIGLGWLYYELDKFSQASQALLKSFPLLQNVAHKNPRFLHSLAHGCTLPYEGNELLMLLESSRLHWLGRTYVDWGIAQDNQKLIKAGVTKLQKAAKYDSKFGQYASVGFQLLRQIPALLYTGELNAAENYLAQSEERLGTQGTLKGHIYLHKELLMLEEHPIKAKDLLESAHQGFVEPAFYSRGLSRVLKEASGLYLMDDKKTSDEQAVQHALVATVLHPYGRNLELLQLAAHKMYWRMGENISAFNKFWQALEEKLWSMEREPFSDLRYMMQSFQEDGIAQIEIALAKGKKAVDTELFRG